ncbi:MAG TPA: type III pantothenate kinase [Williamwhitmania sp.]|nr:type III pantothenate kinase [Williamwhitmania sp.]
MNLVVDIGNTRVKAATYQKGAVVNQLAVGYESLIQLISWIESQASYSGAIVSTVKEQSDATTQKIIAALPVEPIFLSHTTPIPIKNCYTTPETLGNDRLAAAVAAHSLFPNNNVLVIDIGTAITYDLTNSLGEFLGGNISPGIALRLKSLHSFTSKLPLVEANFRAPRIGKNTEEAIQSGVYQGILSEIDGFIEIISREVGRLMIILTGGDANYFVENLKNPIFVNLNIVIDGLNIILEYNKNARND